MPTSDEGKWRIQPGAKHLLTNILPLGVGLCSALTIRCLDPSPGRPFANLTTLNDRLQQQSPPTDLCSNIYLIQDRWKSYVRNPRFLFPCIGRLSPEAFTLAWFIFAMSTIVLVHTRRNDLYQAYALGGSICMCVGFALLTSGRGAMTFIALYLPCFIELGMIVNAVLQGLLNVRRAPQQQDIKSITPVSWEKDGSAPLATEPWPIDSNGDGLPRC